MAAGLGEDQQKAAQSNPIGGTGQARGFAVAVSYLASNGAAYVTGQELHVNGGMFMA